MEITTGKHIDSSILKRNHKKRETCESVRKLCANLGHEDVGCPGCGRRQRKRVTEIYGFIYSECEACSLLYISNPPSDLEIRKLYSSSFYSQFEESLYGDPDIARYRVANIGTPKVKYVEERLGRVGAWLDIGCGTGEVLYAAKPRGWSVQGIETNERAAEIGRSMFGIPITTKFVTEADGAQLVENFDVISMFGVLEHIYNPNAVLATIVQHMKDDAALVLEVPHYPSISCFSQMAFPGLVNRILTPPMHLMIFSLGAMKALLDRHGLAVSHVWYYGQDFYEWVTTLMETSTVEDNTIFDQLLEMTSEFQAVIDKHHLSDEMLVIAKKRDVAS